MAVNKTFAHFLQEKGYEVNIETTDRGQLYSVNGESFWYKEVKGSSFAALHKSYLSN